MMKPRRRCRAVLLAFGLAWAGGPAAQAGWSFTTWQDAPEDVVAQSGGTAALLDEPIELQSGDVVMAAGSITIGVHAYTVHYVFASPDGPLEWVRLRLDSGSPSDLYQILINEYGEAYDTEVDPSPNVRWFKARFLDEPENNRIIYYADDEICTVIYEPIVRGSLPDD